MSSLAIENFRRSELERWIENAVGASEQARWADDAIDLLEEIDGDPDLEDDEIEDIHVYASAAWLLAEEASR